MLNVALRYMTNDSLEPKDLGPGLNTAVEQFNMARNMTEQMGALSALSHLDSADKNIDIYRTTALKEFYNQWEKEPLVLLQWFSAQSRSLNTDTLDNVESLLSHPSYDPRTPNNVYALIGGLTFGNPRAFHTLAVDDEQSGTTVAPGYEFVANQIIGLDKINPQVASRIATGFSAWKKWDAVRHPLVHRALERVLAEPKLSSDVYEIASKTIQS